MNIERIVILDTSAILHSRDLRPLTAMGHLSTTNYVVNELKDARAAVVPEVLNIDVYDISAKEVALARRNYHLPKLLSDTDVSLIVLAMRFRDEKPVVITDDSLLIKFLKKLGIEYLVIFLRRH
ncbi:hypothetical protein [Vulcanisaeta souniana]|uniref:Twitching motility protein PilT n=1 Tax=Vulcanisaeta souniana JCM 11219 TaxID=1293586 RepID=A0A830E1I0_9CREN|nr:hypothetical protein [Vulcanisaeta souniana]BDR91441.1 hypothetical protein Vsou_05340 [Vulcanisaeta souniana JCM 11219]GGI73184.1 hypothetical protein GCM10007112_07560 [Vulcanisaeta souniana JCM 11219]